MPKRRELKQSEEVAREDTVSLLVFRAGSQQPKAVPLSLVTRLEEIDCRRIEISDGRHLVQYRDQLMPLLRIDTETGLKKDGTQPILVFSDHGRSMGLVVDEIVDIVEDKLDIEVASNRPGVLGYAVVKGTTTEIIDVGHFLPQAFEDWFRRRDSAAARPARTILLVDDSAFFRDMLAPLIKAAGYQVVAVGSAADALAALQSGARFDLVVTDIEMPDMDGFALAEAMRGAPGTAAIPIIALAAMVSPEAIERGRAVGFHDFVAKFDRDRTDRGDQGAERRRRTGSVTAMNDSTKLTEYVTFTTGGQLFGLPIERVQDVFRPANITRVPLAGPEIAGVLNLRGRIVTAIRLGNRLDLELQAARQGPDGDRHRMRCRVVRASGRRGRRSAQAAGRRARDQPDQSRPQACSRVSRRVPARWPASCRARRRSGAGSRRRGGGGVNVDRWKCNEMGNRGGPAA